MKAHQKNWISLSWIVALVFFFFACAVFVSAKPASVTFLDVGQGDACLIHAGKGATVLIDGGDEGEGKTLLNYFRVHNIRSLDAVVISHGHEDHVMGILEILEEDFPVSVLYLPPIDTWEEDGADIRDRLMQCVKEGKIQLAEMTEGSRYQWGEVICDVLWPANRAEAYSVNNRSLILNIQYGENAFLLTGDGEKTAQAVLCQTNPDALEADVVKVPHHGGSSALYEGLYDLSTPQFAVISCEVDNYYGHPHEKVLKALDERAIEILRTDENGAISFILNQENIIRIEKTEKWRDLL